jgi:taurine dioxygenase
MDFQITPLTDGPSPRPPGPRGARPKDRLRGFGRAGGFAIAVTGIDLGAPLPDADFARLRRAWFGAGVMVVRDQQLAPDAQIAFSRRFGPLIIHVMDQFLLPGHPEILLISNRKRADGTPVGFEDAGRYWHSDISYQAEPALGSLLYAVEIPPAGGDTMFADMVRAWETLPAATRARIECRRALHSFSRTHAARATVAGGRPALSGAQLAKLADVAHPMVRTVEDTGRRALYVNPGFTYAIEDMEPAESDALLQDLFEHSTRPEFRYVHTWRPGDLLCWDNRSVMHHATLYDPAHIRHMHRTTIQGARPV